MKKRPAMLFFLFICILFLTASALAEEWICPSCGKSTEGYFCSWCGTKKPAEKIKCRNCGTEFDADAGYAFCNICGHSLTEGVSADSTPAPEAPEFSEEDFLFVDEDPLPTATPVPPPTATPLPEKKAKLALSVGDTFTFGSYEQDAVKENGAEPIEWRVLDVADGKALLLSEYVLDDKPYNPGKQDITWENCSLRTWLNVDFLNTAFSPAERTAILLTEVDNTPLLRTGTEKTDGGNSTADYVFLLSNHDVFALYFTDYKERYCAPTPYARERGAVAITINQAGLAKGKTIWWLRSPGKEQDQAAVITNKAGPGSREVYKDFGVRPALWLDLSADIF